MDVPNVHDPSNGGVNARGARDSASYSHSGSRDMVATLGDVKSTTFREFEGKSERDTGSRSCDCDIFIYCRLTWRNLQTLRSVHHAFSGPFNCAVILDHPSCPFPHTNVLVVCCNLRHSLRMKRLVM